MDNFSKQQGARFVALLSLAFPGNFKFQQHGLVFGFNTLNKILTTCEPGRGTRPVLAASSTQTVATWAPTWFLSVFLIFFCPILLAAMFLHLSHSIHPTFSEDVLVDVSSLGVTALMGYLLAILVLWSTSFTVLTLSCQELIIS